MSVVIILLNSYSRYVWVAKGFILQNDFITVVGILIGSSGEYAQKVMHQFQAR